MIYNIRICGKRRRHIRKHILLQRFEVMVEAHTIAEVFLYFQNIPL